MCLGSVNTHAEGRRRTPRQDCCFLQTPLPVRVVATQHGCPGRHPHSSLTHRRRLSPTIAVTAADCGGSSLHIFSLPTTGSRDVAWALASGWGESQPRAGAYTPLPGPCPVRPRSTSKTHHLQLAGLPPPHPMNLIHYLAPFWVATGCSDSVQQTQGHAVLPAVQRSAAIEAIDSGFAPALAPPAPLTRDLTRAVM